MKKIKILHLEDSDLDAELTSSLFSDQGLKVEIKRVTTADAFQKLLDEEQVDLILSDFTIPSFGGLEALKIAHAVKPQIPFIFFSGTMGEDAAVESLKHGAVDYILKGRPKRLVPAIERAIEEARIKSEQLAAGELRRFQANILRSVTDGVVVTRLDGEVTYWNEGARAILKIDADQAVGCYIRDLNFGAGAILFDELLQVCREKAHALSEFPCRISSSSETWVSVKASLLRTEDMKPSGCLFIVRDISDRKTAEIALKKLNVELEQRVADRTEALTAVIADLKAFSYSVSHDLRGPLRAILGYAHVLEEDFAEKLGMEGKEVLDRVSSAGKRMDALINGLLQLSTLMRSEFQRSSFDLSACARSLSDELSVEHPQKHAIWRIQEGLVVSCDPAMMRSALQNLLGNAQKFSSKEEEPIIELGSELLDGETVYYVRDNGVGFDSQGADRMFEPFNRLHSVEEFSGTGIGLSTVQRVIHRHGGTIWAQGKLGEGATIFFTLGTPPAIE